MFRTLGFGVSRISDLEFGVSGTLTKPKEPSIRLVRFLLRCGVCDCLSLLVYDPSHSIGHPERGATS